MSCELDIAGPPKPARLQFKNPDNGFINGLDSNCNGLKSINEEAAQKGKPRFLVSFMVDARGGVVRCTRHSGLSLVIPPGKVCMPTRITCKLVKADKLSNPPVLKEGEALVSRFLEVGPVGINFNGPVLIELPHVASLHNNEREIVALRTTDGRTWHEQPVASQSVVDSILQSASVPFNDYSDSKSSYSIVSSDFPCYFVALSRVRQNSRLINVDGGALTSVIVSDVTATFPKSSVTKETKVGLQVLPVSADMIHMVLGSPAHTIGTSPVITIEPRRRRFHGPISLTIPLPSTVKIEKGNKQSDTSGLRLLYSINGGTNLSKWEDITTSAPLNIIGNNTVSFLTTVSARFWLVDSGSEKNPDTIIAAASSVYKEVVAVPILARFIVYARRHFTTEAQLRVLCLTSDLDTSTTLESQQSFTEVGRSGYIELMEGKSYCMELEGNLVPTAASSSQLAIEVRPFRVNRLSFVVQVRNQTKPTNCQISILPAAKVERGVVVQEGAAVGFIPVSLEQIRAVRLSTHVEQEELEKNIESAKQQAVLCKESTENEIGVTLKLGDIAVALQSDWVPLAEHLSITEPEVIKIQTDIGNIIEQAMIALHLWVSKSGRVSTFELERALKRVGRSDIVDRYIYGIGIESDDIQMTNGSVHDDSVPAIDSPLESHPAHNVHVEEGQTTSDVEPSAVYQIEEVWDGAQWHKSMKMVPKAVHDSDGEAVLEESVKVSIRESETRVSEDIPAGIVSGTTDWESNQYSSQIKSTRLDVPETDEHSQLVAETNSGSAPSQLPQINKLDESTGHNDGVTEAAPRLESAPNLFPAVAHVSLDELSAVGYPSEPDQTDSEATVASPQVEHTADIEKSSEIEEQVGIAEKPSEAVSAEIGQVGGAKKSSETIVAVSSEKEQNNSAEISNDAVATVSRGLEQANEGGKHDEVIVAVMANMTNAQTLDGEMNLSNSFHLQKPTSELRALSSDDAVNVNVELNTTLDEKANIPTG